MLNQETGKEEVSLAPTKAFFVEMLTRDIELEDAILDLLDNCVDGALRTVGFDPEIERPYEGFWAELKFSADSFSIADNCGGISNDVRDSAFRLGRPLNSTQDRDLPTVGTYGIGMKRAIFKLGYRALIETHTKTSGFSVEISKEWMVDELEWNIPITDLGGFEQTGTTIVVADLRPDVAAAFDGPTSFVDTFRGKVAQYYSVLIEKGFEVRIADTAITAMPLTLRTTDFEILNEVGVRGIAPYLYEGEIDGVRVDLAVGFFSPFNIDPDEEPTRGKAEEAGWTVVCNDRVVLYRDKSIVTGWGDGAPYYHPQFRQIAGVVSFSSKDPSKLPITTTKRGIDGQNPIYLQVRKRMRDGLSIFTSYTNQLKKIEDERREEIFKAASPIDVRQIRLGRARPRADLWRDERNTKAKIFEPPLPSIKDKDERKMTFSRPISQIKRVAEFLLGDEDAKPSKVAEESFDKIYGQAARKR